MSKSAFQIVIVVFFVAALSEALRLQSCNGFLWDRLRCDRVGTVIFFSNSDPLNLVQ
jgi:hypothetical protein